MRDDGSNGMKMPLFSRGAIIYMHIYIYILVSISLYLYISFSYSFLPASSLGMREDGSNGMKMPLYPRGAIIYIHIYIYRYLYHYISISRSRIVSYLRRHSAWERTVATGWKCHCTRGAPSYICIYIYIYIGIYISISRSRIVSYLRRHSAWETTAATGWRCRCTRGAPLDSAARSPRGMPAADRESEKGPFGPLRPPSANRKPVYEQKEQKSVLSLSVTNWLNTTCPHKDEISSGSREWKRTFWSVKTAISK